jgi:hypothetical protein
MVASLPRTGDLVGLPAAHASDGVKSGVVWRITTSTGTTPDSFNVSRGVALGYLQSVPFTKQRLQNG